MLTVPPDDEEVYWTGEFDVLVTEDVVRMGPDEVAIASVFISSV